MVLQETWLKSGTIRENIVMGKPDATEEEIIAAAKAAHSYGFIKRMSNGFDTVIVDEADSIMIDEARIPLVIAGDIAAEDDGSTAEV